MSLKMFYSLWIPLLLFFLDVFLFGQGIIALGTAAVVVFYFLPKALASLINKKDIKIKFRRLLIYTVLVVAILTVIKYDQRLAQRKAEMLINALEEYQAEYKRYPDKLVELVPDFLAKIPRARISLLYSSKFSYTSTENNHILIYTILPPFGRKCYNLEEKNWFSLD